MTLRLVVPAVLAFVLGTSAFSPPNAPICLASKLYAEEWTGEVVSNAGGKIKGCTIENGESETDFNINIDGVDADLGPFSEAIYRKFMQDAKQQRFQGFRPGTIPPHVEPTYRAMCMDECAREATLEAMEQNGIRPFTDARSGFNIVDISIPPPIKKNKKKKKKKKKKKAKDATTEVDEEEKPEEPKWLFFETMKEAINAGWKPGQTFSFVAKNCKGQRLKKKASGMREDGIPYGR